MVIDREAMRFGIGEKDVAFKRLNGVEIADETFRTMAFVLYDTHQRNGDTRFGEHFLGGIHLCRRAIDDDDARILPFRME